MPLNSMSSAISTDQASGLRQMSNPHPIRVLSVTGGKGGVGKSNFVVNLAVCMAKQGERVLVLDADLGLANIDILLGLRVEKNLSHVLSGECDIEDVIIDGPAGIKIIPASSGTKAMAELSKTEHAGLIRAFSSLSEQIDTLIIDTAAGISDMVVSFAQASQDIIFVVCNEPTSITDAYALMKVLNRDYGLFRFKVVASMVRSPQEGHEVYAKLRHVCDKFLDAAVEYVGSIPFDENARKSIKKQKVVVEAFPRSPASIALKNLSQKIQAWPIPKKASGNIEFFMERLVQNRS